MNPVDTSGHLEDINAHTHEVRQYHGSNLSPLTQKI